MWKQLGTLHSHESNQFDGEWLLLHCPFRDNTDFKDARSDLMSKGYKAFAMCLLCAPDVWTNLDKIRQDLEVEAHRDTAIESNLTMIRAHTDLV